MPQVETNLYHASAGPCFSESVRTIRKLDATSATASESNPAREDSIDATALACSKFLTSLCQQIRVPLSSMMGMTQMLLETSLDGSQREFAEALADGAQALAAIANAAAEFSRSLTGEQSNLHLRRHEGHPAAAEAAPETPLSSIPPPSALQPPLGRFATRVPAETVERTRVLVVEDNPTNQQVLLRMLARIGYPAAAVSNGAESLVALKQTHYDIVLMDCQMPVLDGYEATRRIRQMGGRYQNIPIIAVTANAIAGDREKCLAAGMSGYLAKPVRAQALARTLEDWIMPKSRLIETSGNKEDEMKNTAAAVTPPCAPATVRAVDPAALQALREMDADDSGFLFKLIEMFLTDMTERVAAMKTAMEAREVGSIKLTAHALKGSCGHFGAVALASLCRKLELIEPQDYARDGETTFRELVAEAHQVRVALLEERELASKHSSTTEENHRWGS